MGTHSHLAQAQRHDPEAPLDWVHSGQGKSCAHSAAPGLACSGPQSSSAENIAVAGKHLMTAHNLAAELAHTAVLGGFERLEVLAGCKARAPCLIAAQLWEKEYWKPGLTLLGALLQRWPAFLWAFGVRGSQKQGLGRGFRL